MIHHSLFSKTFVYLVFVSLPLLSYYLYVLSIRIFDLTISPSSDFGLILCGARSFLENHLLSPYQICAGSNPLSGFLYPPLSILLLIPLAVLKYQNAYILLTILSLFVLAYIFIAMRTLAKEHWPSSKLGELGLVCLIISLPSIMQTLGGGHLNLIILATFLLPLLLSNRHLPGVSGIIIAIGFWIKLYPAMIIAIFLLNKKFYITAIWSIFFILILALIGLIWIPLSLHIEYFTTFLPNLTSFTVPGHSESIIAQIFFFNSGTEKMVWTIQEIPWDLRIFNNALLLFGLMLAILRLGYAVAINSTIMELEAVAILLLAILLTSPLAWGHHFVLAIPAILLLLIELNKHISLFKQLLIVLCWLSLAIPNWTLFPSILLELPGGSFAETLFYMRYALSAICMLGLLVARNFKNDVNYLINKCSSVLKVK
ncbi:MAG TPA: hypothetical protein DEO56_06445 [Nitrosomonas nitrosa]|nr:glycosyltransferase family 87 protein [Nitrosomonas nitrosa]HBZ30221.1 hypothetical protein [Nitrosomonas nitrosa]